MSLADLWSSGDSQAQDTGGWGQYQAPSIASRPGGGFYSDIAQSYIPPNLFGAAPEQTRNGTLDRASQFDAGGVDRGYNTAGNPGLLASDNQFLGYAKRNTPNPYQGGAFDPKLQAQVLAGDRGSINHGLGAFIGTFDPDAMEYGGTDVGMRRPDYYNGQVSNMASIASGLGARPGQFSSIGDMYNQLQGGLNDYYTVGGLTPASTAKNGNMGQRALYRFNPEGGTLDAMTRPVNYSARNDDKAFIGRDSLTALSMALPMFGGWAGMLGSGTAGTLSAGSGLGLTTGLGSAIGTGAANALVNAGMGALTNGSGGQGFLQGLLSQGLGSAAGSLTGSANNLGSLFNTAGAGTSALNPMGYFNNALRSAGLGGSPIGQGTQLAGGLSRLANLWRS